MDAYHLRAAREWLPQSEYLVVTPSMAAKHMFFYVQEIGHFYTCPGYFTERKNLNSFLVAYTASGRGILKYRGKKYRLYKGRVFFIDCMEYQYYETDGETDWEIVWVHFYGGSSRRYFREFLNNGGPVADLPEDTRLPDYIQNMIELHRRKDVRTEPMSSKYIVDLLTELLLSHIPGPRDRTQTFMPDYITAAIDFMEKRYHEPITLDRLARELAVSKYHLSRQFKKYTGVTPHEYLTGTRITAAKELLQNTEEPVGEIAHKVGFENTSFFIRTFKKHEELTPLRFRKQWGRD